MMMMMMMMMMMECVQITGGGGAGVQGDLTKQEFLQGHTNRVSALAVSKSGKYLASGQLSPMGFSAPIIVWDYAGRKILHKLILHKVKIQGLDFSYDDELLSSVGGTDDCKLVIWRTKTGDQFIHSFQLPHSS